MHPDPEPFEFLVGPSTSNEFNTARLRLVPVACWKVEDVRFAFDSSFATPDIAKEIQALRDLRELHGRTDSAAGTTGYPPLSVFGHADPVGSDDYNKALSGRRASVIYALLISNTDPASAVGLWKQVAAVENWGTSQRQTMQTATGLPDGTPDSDLFKAYMKALTPADLNLNKHDFLAQGADPKGKGDFQGCSEFNPLLIFSQQQEDEFEQAQQNQDQAHLDARNQANAPNRRVMVLLFRVGSKVDPAKWPCPRALADKSGCIKRFWSDGQTRRSTRLPDQPRKFGDTRDTFACRFYQRISSGGPCERILQVVRIRLFDRLAQPIPGAPFSVIIEGQERPPDTADANGDITLYDVRAPSFCTVRWSRPDEVRAAPKGPQPDIDEFEASLLADGLTEEEINQLREPPAPETGFEFERVVFIDLDGGQSQGEAQGAGGVDKADQSRLHNLGYSTAADPEENLESFQRDCEAEESGPVADVKAELRKRHEDCNPPLRVKIETG